VPASDGLRDRLAEILATLGEIAPDSAVA